MIPLTVREIRNDKKRYLDLLLIADEQESMIDRYLDRGRLFVLEDDGVKALCVITEEGDHALEIKNIAVAPAFQRQGYGRRLVEFVARALGDGSTRLSVGTGDSPLTLGFYHRLGFRETHRVKGFFTDNYDHPIFEEGKQLIDMVYLEKII